MKCLFKEIAFWALVLSSMMTAKAQSHYSSDEARIPVGVICIEQEGVTGSAMDLMRTVLINVAQKNGLSTTNANNRFCITVKVVPITKDILPGPPTRIAQTLDFVFYIIDNYDQKVFSTATVSVKGVGQTEEKCMIDGFRRIKPSNPELARLANEGRTSIIDYYNRECNVLIREAQALAQKHLYDEAFFHLSAIPRECSECYDKALIAGNQLFQEYVDYLCDVNLAQAKVAWMAEQNTQGAFKAGDFLAYIYPEAQCYGEAMELYKEIKQKVLDDWHFEMKQYQDQIDLESQRIDAWRQVGMAYGNHQQPITNMNHWLLR